ncbi:hypothetical protein O7608_02900 [Solwaraspora sp. WMMA2056]|uniref:hypothetical protein n=1 Tax=Solwaraspora sp. WMMA2056 TaxID=3015161 RepID=UPI00259B0459|nr:hypothetical protein [Solwaraspora sp. WMMA2056]WJK41400.1 hypothetical protein O7608_02900 [Solwaraspora sp. WMMA2056]
MTGVNATPAGPVHVIGYGSQRRRAQLVFTVANLDTGAVASTSLVPGSFTPIHTPGGTWWLPYAPIVTDLATHAGVAASTLRDPDFPDEPGRLPSSGLTLPIQWQPDIPEQDRRKWEAVALADRRSTPWLVLIGRSSEPPPPGEPARLLGRLCALADQLHVDLVLEARPSSIGRGLSWDVRFELAGGAVPDYQHRWIGDLPTALATIPADRAATGLTVANAGLPAHYLTEGALTPAAVPVGLDGHPGGHDLDQLERRMLADAEQHGGAQAIWRNRHWWHTGLRPADTAGRFVRGWEPPRPAYWGEQIPTHPCQRCTNPAGAADPPYCTDCYGARRVRRGAVLTVTDLRGRTVHRNWRPDDGQQHQPPTRTHTDQPSGSTVWQLSEHYQVGPLAAGFGVEPTDLTDIDGEHVIDQHLRNGVSQLAHTGGDPVDAYLGEVAATHDGARVMVLATDWPGPTLDELAAVVRGLGLALDVTVTDHRHSVGRPELLQGHTWSVRVIDPATPLTVDPLPTSACLPEAVALCHRYLHGALRATVPTDPEQPMCVPQQPATTGPGPDVAGLITEVRRLAAAHPGEPATVRLLFPTDRASG